VLRVLLPRQTSALARMRNYAKLVVMDQRMSIQEGQQCGLPGVAGSDTLELSFKDGPQVACR
jgi:hypothetical protein